MDSITDPTVSVLIATHNRRERLPALLDALATEPAAEFLAIVNGDSDRSFELLEAWARRDRRLRPLSLDAPDQAAAQQLGVEVASGDVVLILDDDVVPRPGLIEGHARHHAGRTGLVVVGYMPVAMPSPRRSGQFPIDLYNRSYEHVCDEYERAPGSILRGLWGGNVSLTREDALRVGLKPSSGMPAGYWYHRDRDFGLRCQAAGLEGVFDRGLLARHDHRVTPEKFMRVARDSGHTRWAVHASHRELAGPLPVDFYEKGVPMPSRLAIRISRHGQARPAIRFLLRAVTKIAGLLHLFRIETHAGFLLGVVEQQRGALEAAASMPSSVESAR
jgi:glycosyltransferase involved in cell wall biosynthesis